MVGWRSEEDLAEHGPPLVARLAPFAIVEHVVEQRGLAGTEEAGQDGDRDGLEVGRQAYRRARSTLGRHRDLRVSLGRRSARIVVARRDEPQVASGRRLPGMMDVLIPRSRPGSGMPAGVPLVFCTGRISARPKSSPCDNILIQE